MLYPLPHPTTPPPLVYSTCRSKAVVPVLVLIFVALWFILRGCLFCLTLCFVLVFFSLFLALRLPRLGKRELILVLFVRLFGLRLFGFAVFSSSWCLGRAAVGDCCTPWTFLLPFFVCHLLDILITELRPHGVHI